MTSIQFTPADRDDRGFIKAPKEPTEPRSLADLLPNVEKADQRAARMSPSKLEQATMIALLFILIALAAYLWSSPPARPLARMPTPERAAAVPTTAPVPTAAPPVMLPAYGAPLEQPRWQIEATRAITPVAHYGTAWIQADVAGSGRIWLRAADWPDLAIVGADLAPRPTAPPAAVEEVAPPAPPAPTQCAEVGIPGKQSRSCGTEDLGVLQERAKQLWLEAFGGNIGIVTTSTPYGGTP